MNGALMNSVVQLHEGLSRTAQTTADGVRATVVELPFRETRLQLARTKGACEMLRLAIGSLQRNLKILADVSRTIDDREERQVLQEQIALTNDLLVMRSDQLSDAEKLLQEALRRVSTVARSHSGSRG
jgi:hypothetical protein